MARNITPKETDYSQWYLDIIKVAELADYAPVRGYGDSPHGTFPVGIHTETF